MIWVFACVCQLNWFSSQLRRQERNHIYVILLLHDYIFSSRVTVCTCEYVCVYYLGSLAFSINNLIISCMASQQTTNFLRFCFLDNAPFLFIYLSTPHPLSLLKRLSPWSSRWPGACYVNQADLELTEIFLPVPPKAETKGMTIFVFKW